MSPAVPVRSRSSVRRRYSARERPACLALASMAASTSSGTSRIRMSVNGYPLSLRIPHDIIGRTWTRSRSESSGRGSCGHGIPAFSTCGRSFSPASGPGSSPSGLAEGPDAEVGHPLREALGPLGGRDGNRGGGPIPAQGGCGRPATGTGESAATFTDRTLPGRVPERRREGTHHMGAGQGAGIGGRAR